MSFNYYWNKVAGQDFGGSLLDAGEALDNWLNPGPSMAQAPTAPPCTGVSDIETAEHYNTPDPWGDSALGVAWAAGGKWRRRR
jgi:hypothetical protein